MFAARCGRRIGKTFTLCVIGVETCLSKPNARVMFAFPTQRQARKVVTVTMAKVLMDAPEDLRPTFNKVDLVWTWPHNGSSFHLAGCDDEGAADNLRGDEMDLGIVDEAGFNSVLRYVLDSVLLPQTMTTGGKIALISSPPKEGMGHYFYQVYTDCDANGDAVHMTSREAEPWLAPGELDDLIERAGGPTSVTAQREYGAEFIVDLDHAVVPEFSTHKDKIVRAVPRPEYYIPAVAADFGFNDLTVAVFAYYNFALAKVVIEDEVVCQRQSASEVGRRIAAKERELWPGVDCGTHYADAPLQLMADIYENAGVMFSLVDKKDADGALNHLRMMCQQEKIAIHPRCVHTIAHLEAAVWNRARTTYDRSEVHGHFDGVDAVKYLLRHVDTHTNPMPGVDRQALLVDHFVYPQPPFSHPSASVWAWK